MGLAFIPLYIKYLGIEAYGLIGLFALLNAWLSLLDMGMTPTLGREMARHMGGGHTPESIRDLLRSIEFIALGIALLIVAGVALGADWLATSWLKAESTPTEVVAQAFAVMALVSALRFAEGIYRSSISGLQRQVLLNVVGSLMATLRGLGAVGVIVWIAPTVQAFFLWQGLISVITLVILAFTTYTCLPKAGRSARFSLTALRGVWRFAGGMLGITFLGLLLTQVDKLILSKLLTLAEFGYYSLAAVAAGSIYMLANPITQAWYPRLSQLHASDSQSDLIGAYHQAAQLVTVIVGSAALVLIMFAETLLYLWTQDAALSHRVAPLLSLLALGNLLHALMHVPYYAQLAHGWTGLSIRINVVAVLFIVPAILWATPIYGAEGAAWVWVTLNLGYLLIGVHFMYRGILKTEKWRWYRQDILQPLLAALFVVMFIKLLMPTPVGPTLQLVTLLVAAVATLCTAIAAASSLRQALLRLIVK